MAVSFLSMRLLMLLTLTCVQLASTFAQDDTDSSTGDDPSTDVDSILSSAIGTSTSLLNSITTTPTPLDSFTPAITSTIANDDANNSACDVLDSDFSSCSLATPNFFASAFADQASCLCYTSGTFIGSSQDAQYASCLSFASSADAENFSDYILYTDAKGEPVTTPCEYATSVRMSQAMPTTVTFRAPAVTSAAPGEGTRSGTSNRAATAPRSTSVRRASSEGDVAVRTSLVGLGFMHGIALLTAAAAVAGLAVLL